ncbi:hypothetical protein FHX58_004419 [Paraburkholderia tropica]|nr:hypothetical protein [Paraburkholderia tropica]
MEIPATQVLRTPHHRFPAVAVPPRFSSPRTSLLYLCALLSLCPPLPLAPGTASFPWCSPFGVAFSVRTRRCLPDERPPLGYAVAVPGSVAPLPGGGARRRAVRNAQRDADAVRRWGSGVAVRRCLDPPVRAQRAARPSPIGSWRRVARSERTYRCWYCSRQRGGPPSPASGAGASPRVYVHRTLAQHRAPGYVPCDRYDAGIRTHATRDRVGWCDLGLVEPPSARSAPGHAPLTGMTCALARVSQTVDGAPPPRSGSTATPERDANA